MSGLQLFSSNNLDILLDYLIEDLSEPLPSPLQREIIVVQSKGMERWLSIRLAEKFGIWGNCSYPFPNEAVRELIKEILPDIAEDDLFAPEVLTWRLMGLIPQLIHEPGFESLQNYLGDMQDALKLFQLAKQLAGIFDQYTVYRPEWILNWEEGPEEHWQARLWRELLQEGLGYHKARLKKQFFEKIFTPNLKTAHWPKRLSVFGLSNLPPFHLDILIALSKHIKVTLFLLDPCREYWYDLLSEKKAGKIQGKINFQKKNKRIYTSEELHFDIGYPLLASFGKYGASFFEQVHESFDNLPEKISRYEETKFSDPGNNSLLNCLQSDILNLRKRGTEKKLIAADDHSIQVHSCHSPMREMEVLYDYLLDLFERKKDLAPKDVLIFVPNMKEYIPYIHAVFKGCQESEIKIPYTIIDQRTNEESQIIAVFKKILSLFWGRFSQIEVMDILESPLVLDKFDLQEEDLELIRQWIEKTRIRWGVNGEDRRLKGLPVFENNTWMSGIERLLLGYALPEKKEKLFQNILPCDIEGSDAKILGKFLNFIEGLFHQIEDLKKSRKLSDWSCVLQEIIDQFFDSTGTEPDLFLLQKALSDLKMYQEKTNFYEKIQFEVIHHYLINHIDKKRSGPGLFTGGISFSTFLSMRKIPHRVIAIVGMNSNEFPGIGKSFEFDLMARFPQKGDPNKRDEDSYLFLEALLCAKEKFYNSYIGQSIKDNSHIPPSVIISELLDCLEQGFDHPEKEILDSIVLSHRLQGFHPDYFDPNSSLFSFSKENFKALGAYLNKKEVVPFISQALLPSEELKTVDLERFLQCFINPSRFFCRHQLGIKFDNLFPSLDEQEPFEVDTLEGYQLKQQFLQKRIRGDDLEGHYSLIKAQSLLPFGVIGQAAYKELTADADILYKGIQNIAEEKELPALEFDFQVGGFRFYGRIEGIWPKKLFRYRCASMKAKDFLTIWIEHLILNSLQRPEYPKESWLFGSDGCWRFYPLKGSLIILERLLKIFRDGIQRPLPFFPETSLNYAEKLSASQNPSLALESAKRCWQGNRFINWAEGNDPYFHLCFRNENPLDENFQTLAMEIYQPFLDHCRKEELTNTNGAILSKRDIMSI